MKALFLALPLLAAVLMACAAPPPTPVPTVTPIPTATPDIPATVAAQVAAIPTATAYPTSTPYPTPTPRPTVTPYPTATPRPTYTPYPTATTVPTATPYPTNTPYPTYTPYPMPTPTPAPTPWPTSTPWPTATPVPPVQWTTQRPRSFFSIDVPADWQKFTDDSSELDNGVDFTVVNFEAPGNEASITVASYQSNYGWQDGYTLDDSVQGDLDVIRDFGTNFQLLSLQSVSTTVKRSQYRYDGTDDYCDIEGQALHIFLREYIFLVVVEVCDGWVWKYDDTFVDRMLESFSYPGKR